MNFAIIAAGEGSRLVQEGISSPKPLVRLDGKPMIGRLIDIFTDCNAESISIIVNEQMTEVRDYLLERQKTSSVPMQITVKSTPSSMHSFFEVSRIFPAGSNFFLTTVDTVFRPDEFSRYARAFEQAGDDIDGYMAVTPFIDDEKPLYIDVDNDMTITAFTDSPTETTRFISGGIYGLTTPALDVLQQCMDHGVSRMRNNQRAHDAAGLKLKAYPFPKIVDVDHAADIATAQTFLDE